MHMLFKQVSNALMTLAAATVAFIAVAIGYGVIARKTFLISPIWINDVTSYALLVITFAGGAFVAAKGTHTRVDLLRDRLSNRGKHYATLVADAICFASSLVLAVAASIVALDNFERGTRLIRAIEIPKWIIIAIVAAGAAIVALTYASRVIIGLRQRARNSN